MQDAGSEEEKENVEVAGSDEKERTERTQHHEVRTLSRRRSHSSTM